MHLSSAASTYNSDKGNQSTGELRVEFVIDSVDSKAKFAALKERESELQAAISAGGGETLVWRAKEDVRMCRIYVRQDAEVSNRGNWEEQRDWLRTRLELFDRVFRPVVAEL